MTTTNTFTIQSIHAREVLDSRGNPTVAVRVTLSDGTSAEAMVPSGASTGVHEALELRDDDKRRYRGKGVLRACEQVNERIQEALRGKDALNQRAIDQTMIQLDGSENKSNLGANAVLGVSLAVVRAAALSTHTPLYQYIRQKYELPEETYRLPIPMMNIVNGGVHADNGLNVQEFMIVPTQESFHERVRAGAEIFHALHDVLRKNGYTTGVGDEGGFAPQFTNNEEALQRIAEAVKIAGYSLGKTVHTALDVAASEFYKKGKYLFEQELRTIDDLIVRYEEWIKKYSVISIEDGAGEDAWGHWKVLTKQLGKSVTLVGDDLFVTSVDRLQKGISSHVANAILVKVNQIGTLTEAMDAVQVAHSNGYTVIVSHRSGETEDPFIADLAVAANAEYIKTGSLSRSERIAKYNRLMEIELELQAQTK